MDKLRVTLEIKNIREFVAITPTILRQAQDDIEIKISRIYSQKLQKPPKPSGQEDILE